MRSVRELRSEGFRHDLVGVRLSLSCATLGLPEPPRVLHLRFLSWARGWSMAVWTPEPAPLDEVRAWAAKLGADHARGGRNGERAHWFEDVQVPPPLLGLLTEFRIQRLTVEPGGQAKVSLEGDHRAIESLLAQAQFERAGSAAEVVPSAPGGDGLLTARQVEALEYAAAAGYYRIPRPTTLRELGQQMGVTSAALSELLRRAEAAVILSYLAGQARTDAPANRPLPEAEGPERKA